MPDATPITSDDIARARANVASDADTPTRDPLAPGGVPAIPSELQDRMLQNAEALTQRQEDYMRDKAADYKKLPPVPTVESGKLSKIGPPPTNDIRGDAMAWLGFATALGGIAGAMTKRSSMNALAAFSGALDGLQQGNQQKFNNDFKTWEAQAKATQENNKIEMDGYRNILERNDLDERQRADQLEMWATQNRNKFMIELARASRNDPAIFTSALDSISVHEQKGNDAMSRLVELQVARQNRLEEIRLQGENAIAAARARAESRQPLESEESLASIAQRKYSGDPSAGRYLTGENRSKFDEIFNQVLNEPGHSQAGYIRNQQEYAGEMSGARAVGTRVANLENIQRDALAIVPLALRASEQSPRVPILAVAQAQQWLETQVGDQKLKTFVMYNMQLAEQAAKAQKPGGVLDVQLQQRMMDILSTAQNQGSYRAAVEALAYGIGRAYQASKSQQAGAPLPDIEQTLRGAVEGAKQGTLGPVGTGGANPHAAKTDDQLRQFLGLH